MIFATRNQISSVTPGDCVDGNLMGIAGKYGTAVFETWRVAPGRDFDCLSFGKIPDLDPRAYYKLPVLGIDALAAGARKVDTLGSCRIEIPTEWKGFFP